MIMSQPILELCLDKRMSGLKFINLSLNKLSFAKAIFPFLLFQTKFKSKIETKLSLQATPTENQRKCCF